MTKTTKNKWMVIIMLRNVRPIISALYICLINICSINLIYKYDRKPALVHRIARHSQDPVIDIMIE